MAKTDRVKYRTRRSKRNFYGNRFTKKTDATQEEQSVTPTNLEQSTSSPMAVGVDDDNSVEDCTPKGVVGTSVTTPRKTTSQRKLKNILTNTPKQSDFEITGYRFMDVEILSDLIKTLCCPICWKEGMRLHEKLCEKQGFASLLYVYCACGY